jgi:ABC-2 type transport system ATP-binding protein
MTTPEPPPALAIKDVSHHYGKRCALDGVSFEVRAGTFTVLLGLNGAGKSTLFALITRLYNARRGTIDIFGHDVSREPGEALRRLGVVFQPRTLDLDLSVIQNLAYHAALHGIGTKAGRKRADGLLELFELADRRKDKARNLSGGQMRRLEIARALLHRPSLLLLDEASVGLDIQSRAEIIDHVRRLVNEERIGVLWATHLIDEVLLEDSIVILHEGRVMARGSAIDIVHANGVSDIKAAFAALTVSDRARQTIAAA